MSSARIHPIAALTLVVAAVFVILEPHDNGNLGDATVRYQDMERVLNGHKTEQKFSMVGPLFAAPLYFLGRELDDPERWVCYYNRIVLLVTCGAFWWLLRPVLSAAERTRFIVALCLGSMLPHHLLFFNGEVFTCATVSLGLAAVVVRRAWWGVPLAVAGAVNVPGTVGGLGVASLVLAIRTRRLRFLLAAPAAFGLWLLENYIRRGDAWFTGYDGEKGVKSVLPYSGLPEFSYPLHFGLLSVLFSFGKGLIYFMPALFLTLPTGAGAAAPAPDEGAEDRVRWVYRTWLGFMVGLVLVYSRWWAWYGGWCWGPRFFLFGCFIAALVIARRTVRADRLSTGANLLMLVVLALSGWVAVAGMAYRQTGLGPYADPATKEFVVWYVPECSALGWPLVEPTPFGEKEWWWVAAIATGVCYLAAPVVAVLVRRAPEYATAAWHALRAGPRWGI